jgi:hypothetical protein
MHPLRRMWRWFAVDEQRWVPRGHCPICHREIEGTIGAVQGDGRFSGWAPTEREALIDHCPVHGRRRRRGRKRRRTR